MNFIHLEKIDSTNNYALALLKDAAKKGGVPRLNKTVVTAKEQTAGRGRAGRKFFSPPAGGVYFSLIFAGPAAIENAAIFTVPAAVFVCRALEKFFGVEAKIKWVNDVYVCKKKVCGILAEGFAEPSSQKIAAAVVGIGINIFQSEFPAEIKNKAGAVLQDASQIEDADFLKKNLVCDICKNFFPFCDAMAKEKNSTNKNKNAEEKKSGEENSFRSQNCTNAVCAERGGYEHAAILERNKIFERGGRGKPHGGFLESRGGLEMPQSFSMNAASSGLEKESVFAEYKRRSFLIGRRVRVFPIAGGEAFYEAEVLDIDSRARLVVRAACGEVRRLESGEVSVRE